MPSAFLLWEPDAKCLVDIDPHLNRRHAFCTWGPFGGHHLGGDSWPTNHKGSHRELHFRGAPTCFGHIPAFIEVVQVPVPVG